MTPVISLENVSKYYRLGQIGSQTLTGDLNRWWARLRGKPDPYHVIGEKDHGNRDGEFIWALRNIDLEVLQGEVLGIIGANGAGKSTLLKILSRVTAPTSGLIKMNGRVASMLEVGTGFHPELTGRENIYLNGAILGMPPSEIDRKFDEIVEFSGVEKFINTPVKRYSSGMYVRLAFAVAAHLEPEILVVDEVLAVGDLEFQKKCLGKMKGVARGGRTVLFVSHNMTAIANLCQRAVLLDKGKIAKLGAVDDVIAKYIQFGVRLGTQIEWPSDDAPGNDVARLVRVSVEGETKGSDGIFDIRRPVKIDVEYDVLTPGIWFSPAVLLKNDMGVVIFNSAEEIIPDWENPFPEKGRYHSICTIPGNLLADGAFIVNVTLWGFGRPPQKGVVVEDALRFQILDSLEGDSVRGKTAGKYPGVIRPKLIWTREKN